MVKRPLAISLRHSKANKLGEDGRPAKYIILSNHEEIL